MIAQCTGTPGPQEGSGFKVQTPVESACGPQSLVDLGVPTTRHVEGRWDPAAYGSNPLVECR